MFIEEFVKSRVVAVRYVVMNIGKILLVVLELTALTIKPVSRNSFIVYPFCVPLK